MKEDLEHHERNLRRGIQELIEEFHKETGLRVTALELQDISDIDEFCVAIIPTFRVDL